MSRRRDGLRIDGWIVVDKPAGMTSVQALGRVRRATGAAKLGHGGTLDPAATGLLPVALGEATKTVPWCHDAAKTYTFTVRWGEATATDDVEGDIVETSPARPDEAGIRAALPAFTGVVSQVPPAFSAVRTAGRRAYELARMNAAPELAPRKVRIESLEMTGPPGGDRATFRAVCGKGTYIRALARDLARHLGTVGHVCALRRTRVGPFTQDMAISVDLLGERDRKAPVFEALLPVETALDDIPALVVTPRQASLLRHGQAVAVPEASNGTVQVRTTDGLVAIASVDCGRVRPVRVFNMTRREDQRCRSRLSARPR